MSICYLCNGDSFNKRRGTVRDRPDLDVLECSGCGLVFLSSFSHVRDGFYENAGMHGGTVDKDVWTRETASDDERRFSSLKRLMENKDVLDFGCGNGGFLLKARDTARQVVGVEPEKTLKPYFKKQGIEVHSSIAEVSAAFDLITLFHVLEHLPDPRATLKQLGEKLNAGGCIIVEVPHANDALLSLYQNEAFSKFTYWSCHLFLFTQATLIRLGREAGLTINYLKQVQRYPLSNHLYWMAKGQPGGHQKWHHIDSPELHASYEKQLASIGACDTLLASFSKGPQG